MTRGARALAPEERRRGRANGDPPPERTQPALEPGRLVGEFDDVELAAVPELAANHLRSVAEHELICGPMGVVA